MSRGYTKEQRQEAAERRAEAIAPKVSVDGHRLMMEVKTIDGKGSLNVDVTPLYHFLKEMFTTDWEAQS